MIEETEGSFGLCPPFLVSSAMDDVVAEGPADDVTSLAGCVLRAPRLAKIVKPQSGVSSICHRTAPFGDPLVIHMLHRINPLSVTETLYRIQIRVQDPRESCPMTACHQRPCDALALAPGTC
jgi:hypothetical protein